MDLRRVLTLGAPAGEATTAEAAWPEVCEYVAVAAIQLGDLDLARERATHLSDEAARARVDAFLAEADGRDPCDAADHFNDPSLRHAAAEALARAERAAEAEHELHTLFATTEPGWSGRADALRLSAQFANGNGRLDQVCQLLRVVLQIQPEDSTSRWALIRTLLYRGDLNEAWRVLHGAPKPLDPSNPTDARAWVKMHRRRDGHTPATDPCSCMGPPATR